MRNLLNAILALSAAAAILSLNPFPAVGQAPEKAKGKGGGGGATTGALYGPYYAPPVIPGGPVPRLPDGHPNIQGIYATRFNQAVFNIEDHPVAKPGIAAGKGAIVDPPDGKIPYRPEAAAKAKDMFENHMFEEPEAHCFQSGVPHSGYQHFGFQVVQSPGYLVLVYEYAHSYRIIPTDGRPHIAPGIRLFMGDSVGHWEGDTLVVDTTNQNGKTWFDMAGNFTTPAIHVVERITPVDSNTINYEATVEDPTIYTRPWKIAGQWGRRPDPEYEQMEFACIEGNQDLKHYIESEGGRAQRGR
jgi:hypothetical protein